MTRQEKAIAAAVAKAREGVRFTLKGGAPCPLCGQRCRVVSSPKSSGTFKVRYHLCGNSKCLLCQLRANIKSVQSE